MTQTTKLHLGCARCRDEAEPGWIETDNNGPIVPCFCNSTTESERAWDRAEAQRKADPFPGSPA